MTSILALYQKHKEPKAIGFVWVKINSLLKMHREDFFDLKHIRKDQFFVLS